ncbi:hypothetical protein PQO03_17075 [Lentisphaera profundi]|uniref:Uncharacterized protein n=1 Tax=Lentisphaera profundi TaxID=1658616 RepID=A0ABY7VXM4_9BACT|nr:hypothetical protein [Lentisphaera profundi]WDE97541.1 hypothetical protein PQO03_17075 [Lentisphaera profundi]
MQKHKAYFEERYQVYLQDITLQSVLEDPINTQYLRGFDLINGRCRWIKFHADEFLDCFYTKNSKDLYWIMTCTWVGQS